MTIDFFRLSTLTPQQKQDRLTGVGGSEVRDYILTGRWAELYDIKKGIATEESLAYNLAPMLGIYLEPFHRAWYEHITKRAVIYNDLARKTFRLDDAPFCLAHLDGLEKDEDGNLFPWEGKALNGFTKWDDAIEKYMPQLQWIMFCTGVNRIRFSVLLGNSDMRYDLIPADTKYQLQLFDLVATFWRKHMLTGERPHEAGTPVQPPPQPAPPGEPTIVSMEGNNEWPELAARWLENKPKVQQFEDDSDTIKKLVPAGAGLVFGNGIKVDINKKGSKSIKVMDDKDAKMLPTHPRLVKYVDIVKPKP